MAHSIACVDHRQVAETAPSPWYVEGRGFRICLIYAYRDRLHPGALSAFVRDPPMTAWCLRRGKGSVWTEEGKELRLRRGRWVLLPPRSRRHGFSEDAVLHSIRFRYEGSLPGRFAQPFEADPRDVPALDAAATALVAFLREHVDLDGDHWRLTESMRYPCPAKNIAFSECLLRWMAVWHAALTRLVPKATPPARVDPRIAAAFQRLLTEDFSHALGEGWLAKELGLSRAHFKRLFKAAYGSSVRQVRESHRRTYVGNRLRETDHPIKHIAIDAGFSSQAAFCKWFRQCVGVTPSVFRQDIFREA